VAADFDGDGDKDLAGASATGQIVVMENVGKFFTEEDAVTQAYPAANNAWGAYRIIARDENADGDLDLVVGTTRGIGVYLGGPGMGFVVQTAGSGNTVPVAPSITFGVSSFVQADLDADGASDDYAIACAEDGCLNISTFNGAQWDTLLQVNVPKTTFLATGDVDGDGKTDLVGSGAVLWVALSSRTAAAAPPILARNVRPTLQQVVINEILASNKSIPVISPTVPGGTKSDCVEIYNGTTATMNLQNWRLVLTEVGGSKVYTFPAYQLAPTARMVVQCTKRYVNGPWETGWRLPASGAKLTLRNSTNALVDEVTYPALGEDISYTRFSDAQPTFNLNPNPDPGLPNEFNGSIEPTISVPGPNLATLAAQVAPRMYAVGQDDAGITAMTVFYRIKGVAKFSTVPLYDDGMHEDGSTLDGLYSGLLRTGFMRGTVIEYYVQAEDLEGNTTVRPKGADSPDETADVPLYSFTVPGTYAGLEISEAVVSSVDPVLGGTSGASDWVEIRNTGNQPLNLTDHELGQALYNGSRYAFPDNTVVPVGGYLLIYCDGSDGTQPFHAPFKLSRTGETVLLVKRDNVGGQQVLDRAFFGGGQEGGAFARIGAQGDFRILQNPTPGKPNVTVPLEMMFKDGVCTMVWAPRPGGTAQLQGTYATYGSWDDFGTPTITPPGSPGVEGVFVYPAIYDKYFFRVIYP
jgi:hypothetical protein